jgi:ligand-binding SRPBCC domain-containing protein
MAEFHYHFDVDAPLAAVADFHRDTRALRRLTPPPLVVQFHSVQPLGEGSTAEFILWFGPLPVRWKAVHEQVDRLHGFTDVQVEGPLKFWRHRHRFEPLGADKTRIHEHIVFEHHAGLAGWWTRLVYSQPGLRFLFAYRAWVTRRFLKTIK